MAEDLRQQYKQRFEGDLEPECYEIVDIVQDLAPDRRDFLKVLGGGLLFLVTVRAQDRELPVRVQIADDGMVRAFTGKMEMGQGSRTLLTQAFAEELGVPVTRVQLVMGDTQLCPDDGGTWASVTTPQTVPVIRKAAAAVRASQKGGNDSLTPPASWKTLGQSTRNLAGHSIVTGEKIYPSDVTGPGVLHAAIVRSPHHKATLLSMDAARAERIAGVRVVRDQDLVAVLAPALSTARRASVAPQRMTTWPYWLGAIAILAGLGWMYMANQNRPQVAQDTSRETTRPAPQPSETTGAGTPNQTVADLTGQLTRSVDGMRTTLQGISDSASAQAAMPRLQQMTAELDKISNATTGLSPQAKSAVAAQVASAMPAFNQLCDRVLAIPGVAGVAKPVIESMRTKLEAMSRA